MAWSAGQRYAAEFVGTYGLVFSITAPVVFTVGLSAFDAAARVTLAGLSIGFGVIAMVYVFGDISGAHLNPAITVGLWVAGRFKGRDVVPYVVAQLAGGVVAVATVAGVAYGYPGLWSGASGPAVAFAAQGYAGNGSPYSFSWESVFLLELAMTMLLVLVVLFTTRRESFSKNLAPVAIGLSVGLFNLIGIPVDGASVNPARSFAPALLSASFSADQWAIQQDWLFWVAPLIGGLLAAGIDRLLRTPSGTD